METRVSKSKFKPRALEFFRVVETTGKTFIITDRGKPVVKIVPFTENTQKVREALRSTIVKYTRPTDPVGLDDWDCMR